MPYWYTFTVVRNERDEVLQIPESYLVNVRETDTWKPFMISRELSAELFETLRLTAALEWQCSHAERFLRLYKATESLGITIEIEFRAIRNALSHPSASLTSKATIATLKNIFHTVHIDLSKYAHQKAFFHHLSVLIQKHDQLLASRIRSIAAQTPSERLRPVFRRLG